MDRPQIPHDWKGRYADIKVLDASGPPYQWTPGVAHHQLGVCALGEVLLFDVTDHGILVEMVDHSGLSEATRPERHFYPWGAVLVVSPT